MALTFSSIGSSTGSVLSKTVTSAPIVQSITTLPIAGATTPVSSVVAPLNAPLVGTTTVIAAVVNAMLGGAASEPPAPAAEPTPAPQAPQQPAPAPAPETPQQPAPAPVPEAPQQPVPTPAPETPRQISPSPASVPTPATSQPAPELVVPSVKPPVETLPNLIAGASGRAPSSAAAKALAPEDLDRLRMLAEAVRREIVIDIMIDDISVPGEEADGIAASNSTLEADATKAGPGWRAGHGLPNYVMQAYRENA